MFLVLKSFKKKGKPGFFKTEQFFSGWGYSPIPTADGRPPDFLHASLSGERAIMLAVGDFSAEARLIARRHEGLWKNRIVIRALEEKKLPQAA